MAKGPRIYPRPAGPLELRLFLNEESDLTHAQVRRAQFLRDPEVAGVWAVNIVQKGNSQSCQLIVYTNKDPWDFEEVEFTEWPPKHGYGDLGSWLVFAL